MSKRAQPLGPERRSHDRVELKLPVDYSSVDAFFSDFTQNINEGGMFIETETEAELGTLVQLQFRLPGDQEPIAVQGRVAWLSDGKADSPQGVGIEFQDLSNETRARINEIVRSLRS